MNCEDDDDWLGGKFKKLIHNDLTITAVVMIPIYSFGIYDSVAVN